MSIGKISVFLKNNKINRNDMKVCSFLKRKINIERLAALLNKDQNYTLKKAIGLENRGIVGLKLPCDDTYLKLLYKRSRGLIRNYSRRVDDCNIVIYDKEWRKYPTAQEYLSLNSKFYFSKNLGKEIYFSYIDPYLKKLPKGSLILDVGAGVGRFAYDLIKRGYRVHLVDSSEAALKKILRYLVQQNANGFDLHWSTASNLSIFPDNNFDSIFAVELICYNSNPGESLREIVRVTKKNGLIFLSVEGKFGALLSEPSITLKNTKDILKTGKLFIKNFLYVHYFTRQSLRSLLSECGIKVLDIFGCHYVPDGIFHKVVDGHRLNSKDYRNSLLELEDLCRSNPMLKDLARVWLAVGRKK